MGGRRLDGAGRGKAAAPRLGDEPLGGASLYSRRRAEILLEGARRRGSTPHARRQASRAPEAVIPAPAARLPCAPPPGPHRHPTQATQRISR